MVIHCQVSSFPEDTWQCLEMCLVVITRKGGGYVLLASSGWRTGMQLNILQHIKQSSTAKNYLAPNIHSTEVEKPWCTHVEGIPWAEDCTKFVIPSAWSF